MKLSGTAFFLLIVFVSFFSPKPLFAQSAADDSTLYKNAVYNTISVYHKSIGDQYGLYNGSQYGLFPFSFAEGGHPFFKTDKPGIGSVVYDDVLYENVALQYDEIQEVLVMQDSTRRIQLLNPRITGFTLLGDKFTRIVKDSTNKVLIRSGFYEVLYQGSNTLLKREEKLIREEVSTGVLVRFIDVHTWHYLQRGNDFYSIKSKNSFLNFFKDRKKELRQYIRNNNLSYRKDRDNMLTRVTAYYDQLIK